MSTGVVRLILVRHGETDYNSQLRVQGRGVNTELNSLGVRQAILLAERLKNEPFDFVACSTLTRAKQTCDKILEIHPRRHLINVKYYPELQEMYYGEWEGKVYDSKKPENIYEELKTLHSQWTQGNFLAQPPGGETVLQVVERANSAISDMINQGFKSAKYGLVVCHGRLLKILLSSLLGMGLQNMHRLEQHNTAVNILEFDGHRYKAITLNCTKHLDDANVSKL